VVTEEVQQQRVDYWDALKEIDPEKLVFIDESGFWVGMTRPIARAAKGKKVYERRKFYRSRKMTIIGAIKRSKVVTQKILEGSMKKENFLEFIKVNLVPNLEAGDVVVMDNLNSHHRKEVKEMIESVGAKVQYLPVYSPEFNPIEMMWSQLKSLVRKFKTETPEGLAGLIELAVKLVDTKCLNNWFTKCCYCA
jgi:transposase